MVLLTSLMYFHRIAWFKHGWAFGGPIHPARTGGSKIVINSLDSLIRRNTKNTPHMVFTWSARLITLLRPVRIHTTFTMI